MHAVLKQAGGYRFLRKVFRIDFSEREAERNCSFIIEMYSAKCLV